MTLEEELGNRFFGRRNPLLNPSIAISDYNYAKGVGEYSLGVAPISDFIEIYDLIKSRLAEALISPVEYFRVYGVLIMKEESND